MLNILFQTLVPHKLHWSSWKVMWEHSQGQDGDKNSSQQQPRALCLPRHPEAAFLANEHGESSRVSPHEHKEWHLLWF